jgi:hypothetical protein
LQEYPVPLEEPLCKPVARHREEIPEGIQEEILEGIQAETPEGTLAETWEEILELEEA